MPADIEIPKHRKKKPTNKPFVIQYRCTGSTWKDGAWLTHSKYTTEQRLQQALADLTSKNHYNIQIFEYRIKP